MPPGELLELPARAIDLRGVDASAVYEPGSIAPLETVQTGGRPACWREQVVDLREDCVPLTRARRPNVAPAARFSSSTSSASTATRRGESYEIEQRAVDVEEQAQLVDAMRSRRRRRRRRRRRAVD
jgi:hypothetical protein